MGNSKNIHKTGIIWWVLLIFTAFVALICWYLGNCKGLTWFTVSAERQAIVGTGDTMLSASEWLSATTGFYELLITYLIAIVAFVLVAGFLYTNHASKLQTKAMAEEVMESEYFTRRINGLIHDRIIEMKNDGLLSDLVNLELEDVEERLSFLEENLNCEEKNDLEVHLGRDG